MRGWELLRCMWVHRMPCGKPSLHQTCCLRVWRFGRRRRLRHSFRWQKFTHTAFNLIQKATSISKGHGVEGATRGRREG